jgi:hypothetical protein
VVVVEEEEEVLVEEEEEVVELVVVVVLVVVILTVEDGHTAGADHYYDRDGDGGVKTILGYLSSYQVPLPCLE